MAKRRLKIDQLAKLRQFTPGMDVEKFLSGEFRQYTRALEQSYIDDPENRSESEICTVAADIHKLTTKITTTGRKLWVGLVWSGIKDTSSSIRISSAADGIASGYFQIIRDITVVAQYKLSNIATGTITSINIDVPAISLSTIEHNLAPGSYTYKVQALADFGSISILNSKLLVYEF